MGHRALHAVPTAGGGYDCVRTRWGGLAVFDSGVPDPPDSRRRPVADGVGAAGVLRTLEPTDEALFVHREDVAYLVRRVDVPTVTEGDPEAAVVLLPVGDAATARRLDGDLATAKGILGDAVDAGLLSRDVAEGYLQAFVERHPDAGAAIWLPPTRRVAGRDGKPPP